MSHFIDRKDYDTTVHTEILDAVTRQDSAIIEACEERAISEMRGYLSDRYDCNAIFSATGSARHPLILMFALDIAVYHCFCVHNPQKLSQMRKDRYDRATEYLRGVARGKFSFEGARLLDLSSLHDRAEFKIMSNHKRKNQL